MEILFFPPTGLIKVLHGEDEHALALTQLSHKHYNTQNKHPKQDNDVIVAGIVIGDFQELQDSVGFDYCERISEENQL